MDFGFRFFQMMSRFWHMRIPERLGMLPRSEHIVLEMLLTHEQEGGPDASLSSACIARRLKVTAPAISRTMRLLRERGFIDMEPDPRDRRGARIRLTEAGRRSLESDRERLETFMARAASGLSPGELEQFFSTFDRLYDSMTQELDALGGQK